MDRDGKKMWNLIRAMNDESKQSAPIVIEKDEQMYRGWRAANCFIDDYQETSTLKVPHSRRHEVNEEMKRLQREEPCPEYIEKPFNMKELQEALDDLKTNKSPDPDQITNDMIKQLGKKAKAAMLDIFNSSWKTGHVPQIIMERDKHDPYPLKRQG